MFWLAPLQVDRLHFGFLLLYRLGRFSSKLVRTFNALTLRRGVMGVCDKQHSLAQSGEEE